jgi:transcriptional pleiotropic regulator of transition state genes
MANGVARKVDQLGRVVLPVEMRKALEIHVGDLVMMSAEDQTIVLSKVAQRCVFCSGSDNLREYAAKLVCGRCADQVSALFAPPA